jgi:hypothetical protein
MSKAHINMIDKIEKAEFAVGSLCVSDIRKGSSKLFDRNGCVGELIASSSAILSF